MIMVEISLTSHKFIEHCEGRQKLLDHILKTNEHLFSNLQGHRSG